MVFHMVVDGNFGGENILKGRGCSFRDWDPNMGQVTVGELELHRIQNPFSNKLN